MSDKFYDKLLDNLRGEPLLTAFIGTVFILIVGGGGAYVALRDNSRIPNPGTLVAVLVLGVLLLFLVLAQMLLRHAENRRRAVLHANRSSSNIQADAAFLTAVPDSRIRALADAIEQLKRIVQAQWVKSDLRFDLAFSKIPGDSANVRLKLSASFKVINVTEDGVLFPFMTEVEVESNTPDTLRGHLSVKKADSELLTHDVDIKLNAVTSNLRRHRHAPTTLEPGCTYVFAWSLDAYVVPLPYCEYWASAHPVINLQIGVSSAESDICASAVIYRPIDQGIDEDPVKDGNAVSWRAHGVFLPYQGVLLKVFKAKGEQS